jgi:helicase
MVTQDGGSVLVFCGSKPSVRATALAIAAARGANTRGVDPNDLARLHRVCAAARVGLHYKDWEHKREAERAFRNREIDVLVATTTVAAGVNLPARAVVVRDTQIGVNKLDVATV